MSCSEGTIGGIVILWDTGVIQIVRVEESSHMLSYRFRNCVDEFSWLNGILLLLKDLWFNQSKKEK